MAVMTHGEFEPSSWARVNFAGARMGDRRRKDRLFDIAAAMAAHPGWTIPQMFETPYEINAVYEFFKRPEATPDRIQAGHRKLVTAAMREPGRVCLILEDSSELTWPGNAPVKGLGPIGSGAEGLQGFILHSSLVVSPARDVKPGPDGRRPPLEILGLADQRYYIRQTRTDRAYVREPGTPSESDLWMKAGEHLGSCPEGATWVRVADRGADIYEYMDSCQKLRHGFVVRAAQDRTLVDEQGRRTSLLFETVRRAPPLGSFTLHLRSRPGQAERDARLSVSTQIVRIQAPQRPGRKRGELPPIVCCVTRVWETNPPEGVPPLEWILLTDPRELSFEAALESGTQYAARWIIEEFHKGLKTGMGAENLQLEEASRLFAAISIMSVVALRLIDFRDRIRRIPDAPASQSGLTSLELKVLAARLGRILVTVRDVGLAVARLGGHMNRKADGLPGWITLWRGMQVLVALVQGYHLAMRVSKFEE